MNTSHGSCKGSVGKGKMSITREMGNLDEQLQNLREAVRKEREKRGGGRVWTSSERVQKGVTVKRTSVLSNRLPVKRDVIEAPEVARSPPRPQSAEVSDTLQRIREFDLFTGMFLADARETNEQDVSEVKKAKEAYLKDFEEIESYRYDEAAEERKFRERQQTAVAPKTVKISPPPCPSPPPEKKARPHRGGIWNAYDIDAKSGSALTSFKTKPVNSKQPAGYQSTVKDRTDPDVTARMAELQNILLSPPPTDGDPEEHQRRQQDALRELQKLQRGEPTKPQWTYKGSSSKANSSSSGGGALLEGTYNEEENRKQFEDAVRMWRGGDPAQSKRKATMSTAIGDNTPVIKPLTEQFISELDDAAEFVYFNHLLECSL